MSDLRRLQLIGGPLDGAVMSAPCDRPILIEQAIVRSEDPNVDAPPRERHTYAPRDGTPFADYVGSVSIAP